MDNNDIETIKKAIETTKRFKTNAILARIKALQDKKGLSLVEIKEIDVLQDMLENIYIKAESNKFDEK